MTDEERGAFERIQEQDPAWADVAIVIRKLAKERLAADNMLRAIAELNSGK